MPLHDAREFVRRSIAPHYVQRRPAQPSVWRIYLLAIAVGVLGAWLVW
jgi:hypothetical protein